MPPSRSNPNSGRNVARYYHQVCGWNKADARKEMRATKKGIPGAVSSRRSMTAEEEREWTREARREQPVLRDALLFALASGLRVSELVKAHNDDLSEKHLSVLGKGSKFRDVPITPPLRRLLHGLPSQGFLFPGKSADGHISAASIEAACRRIGARSPALAWVTPHVLRHTWTTRQVEACREPGWIRDALGHDSIKTTLIYIGALGFSR